MTDEYTNLKEDIGEIKTTVEKIFMIINGNGGEGLKTKVALNRQSINRVWWWLGGISLGIIGAAIIIIRNGVK